MNTHLRVRRDVMKMNEVSELIAYRLNDHMTLRADHVSSPEVHFFKRSVHEVRPVKQEAERSN